MIIARLLLLLPFFLFAVPANAVGLVDRATLDEFVDERLRDAILLMDQYFRVPKTGQYLDAIRIGKDDQSNLPSSIAATGIGLVSLAIGDSLGIIDNAEEKAIVTLEHLVARRAKNGFQIQRSRSGWYPHFINPHTGVSDSVSQRKFSTIDTALLASGAAIAARYFSAKSFTEGRGESRVFLLAGRLVGRVRWASAIHKVKRGLVHLLFTGEQERKSDKIFATPFDEYALLPCIAMRGEQLAGREGPAHELFMRHYSDTSQLPMNDFAGINVIGKRGGRFIAHFTHQFVYYYCNNFNGQGTYREALRRLADADRAHFEIAGKGEFPAGLWGVGAGAEIKFREDGSVERSGYGVANLAKNPNNTASPAIMAGFAPLFRAGSEGDPIRDLHSLWHSRLCRYDHQGLGFLWRCSARNTDLKVKRVEAIDFSTYILGLAGRHPKITVAFFRHFNL